MSGSATVLSAKEHARLGLALQNIRKKVRWKPGKCVTHFKKRQRMQHLPPSSSLSDYDELIYNVIRSPDHCIYFYEFRGLHYYGIRGLVDQREWLVIFGESGILETAFPPDDMDEYLRSRGFVFIGRVSEVLAWTTQAGN